MRVSGHPDGNELYHIHADHLGSVAILTKYSDGYTYGNSRAYYYPSGVYRVEPSGDMTGRRFTGQRENMEWGLYYYNARYYVPGLGRFASADTIVPDPVNPLTRKASTAIHMHSTILSSTGILPVTVSNVVQLEKIVQVETPILVLST